MDERNKLYQAHMQIFVYCTGQWLVPGGYQAQGSTEMTFYHFSHQISHSGEESVGPISLTKKSICSTYILRYIIIRNVWRNKS